MTVQPYLTIDDLASASYVGRGALVGLDRDGEPYAAYWLTGRSEPSRQRKFQTTPAGIEVVDTSGGPHDELRHYACAMPTRAGLLIGNGDHVAQLGAALAQGHELAEAMLQITYEPDAPIRTPRIVIEATARGAGLTVQLASARAQALATQQTARTVLRADVTVPAQAWMLTTYWGTPAEPTPSGEPREAQVDLTMDEIGDAVWDALDSELRVALVVIKLRNTDLSKARILPTKK